MATNEYGSASPYTGATLDQLHESLGIPQFSGASGTDWYLVFNGMIIQGGTVSVPAAATTTIPFVTAFGQQVLGVFLQEQSVATPMTVPAKTLSTFDVNNTGVLRSIYWWAIGV